jgi:DNA invertase Pin-like site-specific DNA recombinase
VIQSSSPVDKTDGNSGSSKSDTDMRSVPNPDSDAVCLSRPIPNEKPFYVRRDVLSRKNTLNKSMSNDNTENKKIAQPKAVIYVRVSSKKQAEEGYSIDAQKTNCNAYSTIKGYDVVKMFIDDGVSAATHLWSRPAGQLMHKYILDHDIKHIIVIKMDRLFRDVQDLLSTIDELRVMEVDLHLLEYNGTTLDTSSAMGRFFLTVIGGIAELERAQISERTKVAMDHMKSQCKVFTGSMYGWDRKGDDMVPNWHEQSLIDYMRDLFYGYGFSGYQVAEFLDDIGETGKLGGKWRSSLVIRTMNYEFHQQREKFPKPDWWVNADFHDTIPWGTTEFLDLYPEPIDDGVSQVDSKSKDTAGADRKGKGKSTS